MGNFSRTYPMVSFLRAVYSVTTLCFHPATGHTSHLSHTFSLQDDLKLRQKLISSLFSSFSIPLPVSQLMMCASYSPRPRSTLCSASSDLFSLSLHWLSEVPPHPWLPQLSVTPKTHLTVPFQQCSGNETSLCESVQSRKHGAQHVLRTL